MKYLLPLLILIFAFFVRSQSLSNNLANNPLATFIVTRNDDRNNATCEPGDCSLREAINAANNSTGVDTINFAPSLANQRITLTLGQLPIASSMNINATGVDNLAVSGNNTSRVFSISSGGYTVAMTSFSIINGYSRSGGGIYNNEGTLTLNNMTIDSNSAPLIHGDIIPGLWTGGGIYSTGGTLRLTNVIVSGNSAYLSGGGIYTQGGTLNISGGNITNNSAQDTGGGGIGSSGTTITITGVNISNNKVIGSSSYPKYGGGLYSSSGIVTVTSTNFSGNTIVGGNGGGAYFSGVTSRIENTIINASSGGGLGNAGGSLTIINSTISGNNGYGIFLQAQSFGGAATLRNVTVTNNSAGVEGGGIYNNGSALSMANSIVAYNTAPVNPDIRGYIGSLGNNLVRIRGTSYGYISTDLPDGSDPKLGALQNNGGTTLTHALLTGSAAIDSGNNDQAINGATPLSTDQRGAGFPRFRDGNGDGVAKVDIGAFEVQSPLSQCTYSLSSTNTSVASGGITRSVNVITQAGCSWTAVSNASWITITSGSTGTGNGTVNFSVAANTGDARTGTITIAGQTFTISQSSGISTCTITLPPDTLQFPSQGGTGTFAVTTNNGCAWTATTTASWITITSGTGTGNGSVSFTVAAFTSGGSRTGTIIVGGQSFTIEQDGELQPPARRTPFDFDGDGKADFSIYRPEVGEWWYLRSSDGGNAAAQFGTSTDKIVPADYTGDGRTDFAFYRKGEWFILRSEDFSYYAFPFGLESDIPVPADYDGDGKADAAVFRPSTQVWYILQTTGGVRIEQFGANGDVPIPADYNGDGKADLAVYNNTTNNWRIRTSNSETAIAIFRANTYKAVPADYTGDGKADIALYDFVTNDWFVIRSENQSAITVKFGTSDDIPVPADYDGDGKTDFAIYRPSTKHWWYAASSANGEQRAREFGVSTDIPVPAAYVR